MTEDCGTTRIFIDPDNEDGMDIVAAIGRACSYLLEGLDIRWTPEQLRTAVMLEVDDVIATTPWWSPATA